ncbi:hypothetical protein [Shewanella glacialipiscicola]|uniref:hypothetical protein n=1 Tax=Shewanella glacialipiscicola TaxID=614069 RepID=UPI003D7A34E4
MQASFKTKPLFIGLAFISVYYSILIYFLDGLFNNVEERDAQIYFQLSIAHLMYVLTLLLPFLVLKRRYLAISIQASYVTNFTILMIGIIITLIYFQSTVGIYNWLKYPRWSYEVTRVGKIWLWSLSITLISMPMFIFSVLQQSKIQRLILLCLSCFLLYFFGSKQLILTFGLFFLLFELSRGKVSLLFISIVFVSIISAGIYILALSFTSFNYTHIFSYFDYVSNGYLALKNKPQDLYYLELLASEYWSLIPRGLGIDKPDLVGQTILNYKLGLGNPAEGYTPAILRSTAMYIDAGWIFPVPYFLFDLKYLWTFISVYIVFYNTEKNKKLVTFAFIFLFLPNLFPFFPPFYTVLGCLGLSVISRLKITKL